MSQHKVFEYPVLILESHLDTFGHVNNATYLSLFEEARWALITENGFGLDKIRETRQGPTIMKITIQFKRELKNRTPITIRSQLVSYKGKIGIMRQWMESQGVTYCEAEFVFGLFDLTTRKLIDPTPAWSVAVGLTSR